MGGGRSIEALGSKRSGIRLFLPLVEKGESNACFSGGGIATGVLLGLMEKERIKDMVYPSMTYDMWTT